VITVPVVVSSWFPTHFTKKQEAGPSTRFARSGWMGTEIPYAIRENAIEQNQSKRAVVKSREGVFFLRKKPHEDMASGYIYSGFAVAVGSPCQIHQTFAFYLPNCSSLLMIPCGLRI
jgi:hypothetical protein